MGLLNAEQFRAPYGAPAIHVGERSAAAVLAAAARGSVARVVAHYRRTPATARNIVVDHARSRSRAPAGRGDDAAQFLVAVHRRTRRRSGVLAGSRCARCCAAPPAMDVVLTANSGHELGHLGLDDVRRAPARLGTRRRCWLHWGANLGATGGTADA